MINKVILLGRLGQDPEVKEIKEGKTLANFSLATNKKWKDKNGEDHESTEWHRVVIFGKLANVCGKYLSKGSQVYLEGEIHTRSYEDKDGNKKFSTEIHGNNVQFLGAKKEATSEDEIPF